MNDNVKQTDWGYEIVWANAESYSGKIVAFSNPGITDLQFHKYTNKSWFINDGQFKVRWVDTSNGSFLEASIKEGGTFDVPAMTPVSIQCLSSSGSFTEVSDKPSNENDTFTLISANNLLGNNNES
jgi:hypothetical protein